MGAATSMARRSGTVLRMTERPVGLGTIMNKNEFQRGPVTVESCLFLSFLKRDPEWRVVEETVRRILFVRRYHLSTLDGSLPSRNQGSKRPGIRCLGLMKTTDIAEIVDGSKR